MRALKVFSFFALALILSGCGPKVGGNDYAVEDVGEISTTLKGKIVGIRNVTIHTNRNGEDITAMATVGGAAIGSQFGKGDGQVASTILGGVAGAMAGEHINKKMSQHPGFQYQVELDGGELVTITQGTEPTLYLNQRVLLVKSERGRSRILPDTTFSN